MVSSRTHSQETAGTDAMLSALIPGLGQLNQRRFAPAAYFLVEALALVALLLAAPAGRVVAVVGLVGVTLWSMVDAFRWRSAKQP